MGGLLCGKCRRQRKNKKRKSTLSLGVAPLGIPATQETSRQTYERACRLAAEGRHDAARALYEQLGQTADEAPLKALARNDLAALLALQGDIQAARQGFEAALALDTACTPAQENLALLDEEALEAAAETRAVAPPPARLAYPDENVSRIQAESLADAPPGSRAAGTGGKVAILSFLFNWPSTGGGIVHTVELARFLADAGYEVKHFYARYNPWEVGRVERLLPFPSEALEFDEVAWNLPRIQEHYRRAVDAFGPDHVIITDSWNIKPHLAEAVHGYPYVLRFQALECLCPLNNVRLLPEGDGRFGQCSRHQLATPLECARCLRQRGHRSGSLHRAERQLSGAGTPEYHERLLRALREAKAVLVVNPLMEAMLSPYSACVRVVTAGMDPARFPYPWPGERRRGADGKVRLFFAGLVEEAMKGFQVLHEACQLLWRRRQDFELVATADPAGPADAFMHFVGWQSQEDLPRHFHDTDVCVIPTIAQEALGRTAVEAMAAGRPVIASRLGGLQFTVADGATGLLSEPGDPEDLAHKIETLLDDPDLRRRLGEAGRRRFEEHYSWEVIIRRHYLPLLGPPARPKSASGNGYAPVIPERVDRGRLVEEICEFFRLQRSNVEAQLRMYAEFSEAKGYARTLGERKTLCVEEAFLVYVTLAAVRPRTVVEIGTQHGKSTRRILDIKGLLGLDSRVACFDKEDQVQCFTPEEAELRVMDLTGKYADEVLQPYQPDFVFCDVHTYDLLKEVVTQTLRHAGNCALVLHDCGRGLCNPQMTLRKDDLDVSSSTGIWERHVLAEVFGVDDPLSARLDDVRTAAHRLRVFGTPHGLAIILPRADAAFPAEGRA